MLSSRVTALCPRGCQNIVTIDKRKGTTAEQSPRKGLPLFFITMINSLILTDFSLNKRTGEC